MDNCQLYYLFVGPSNRGLRPRIIHSSISSSPINILFFCAEKRLFRLWRFLIQYPWTLSLPGTFQFCIFLHGFLIFSSLVLTLSLGRLSFTLSLSLSLFRSFNHSASLLCFFLTPQILLQNFVHSSAFGIPFDLIPFLFNYV